MVVWHHSGDASVSMDSKDVGLNHLGTIVENLQIQRLLLEECRLHPQVTFFTDSQIHTVDQGDDSILMTLNNSQQINASLLIIAEGRESATRSLCGIESQQGSYQKRRLSLTLVANYRIR